MTSAFNGFNDVSYYKQCSSENNSKSSKNSSPLDCICHILRGKIYWFLVVSIIMIS